MKSATFRVPLLVIVLLTVLSASGTGQEKPAATNATATTLVLDTRSFWRCHQMLRDPAIMESNTVSILPRGKGGMKWNSLPPPADWMKPEFNDGDWWRAPGPFYGGHGFHDSDAVALLCLRGKFSVDDPAKVKALTLSCRYRGGIVVYLNGKEVKRANLPEGAITPDSMADVYPLEVYAQTNGTSTIRWGWGDPGKFADRCEQRMRKIENVALPGELLQKGMNVVAIEIHRAPYAEGANKLKEWWSGFRCHAGLDSVALKTDSPAVVASNTCRSKGFQVWNANTMMAIFDMDYGDPNEVLGAVRISGARNGSFSGQVVASCDAPIKGLKAVVGALAGPSGSDAIAASTVQVRYARPGGPENGAASRYGTGDANRFDTLEETPPAEVPVYAKKSGLKPYGAVQPIWVTVNVPSTAVAGEYKGTLTISAEGQKETAVPVVVTVADWTVPDQREYVTFVDLIESPESVAMYYDVPLWSEKHWDLVDRTFRQLGRVGNKTVYIPLICKTHFGNSQSMVRWIKQPLAEGAKVPAEAPVSGESSSTNAVTTNEVSLFLAQGGSYTGDFAVLEKYLDIAQKHLGKPEVVCFYVWEGWCGGGYFNVGGTVDMKKVKRTPVTMLDPKSGAQTTIEGPTYFDQDRDAFFKPVIDELRERMKRRGLEKAMMLGIGGDVRPHTGVIDYWTKLMPEGRWVSHSHAFVRSLGKVPVAYATTVWQAGFAPDPDTSRMYGWRRDEHPNKAKGQAFAQFNRDMVFGHLLTENRLLAERNIAGNQVGFGRNGADFWPPYKDKDGRKIGMLVNRYPESNWAQLSVKTCLLAPGPDGAISTVRWEMMVESVQECEARITIEKALLDKGKRAKLGEEEAKKLQAMIDERTRACEWGWQNPGWLVSSGWQERTARLYAAAAGIAAKLK